MECLSSQGQRGGNSSCQESKLPRVQPRAGSGTRDAGWEPGRKEAPGARRGRWPCREQVVRRLRSRPHGSNFPTAWRVNGSEKAREAGKEGAVRGSWYRVHVRSGAAPRTALRWIGPGRPPARLLTTAASRRRCEGSSAARWPLLGPLRPSALCWPPAGRNFRRAAGSDEARPNRPEARHPGTPCPGPDRQPSRDQRPAAVGLVSSPSIALAALFPESPPRLKSAINFPSLPPPCSAPAAQTPPPDAPPSPPASPSPGLPRRAPPPTLPPWWAPGSLSPPPLTPLGPPGAARSRGQALRA